MEASHYPLTTQISAISKVQEKIIDFEIPLWAKHTSRSCWTHIFKGSTDCNTLFLFATNNPIFSFSDNITLHYSLSFHELVLTKLNFHRPAVSEALNGDLETIIIYWGARKLLNVNASNTLQRSV